MKIWFLCFVFFSGCVSNPSTSPTQSSIDQSDQSLSKTQGSADSKTDKTKSVKETATDSKSAKLRSKNEEYYLDLEEKVKKFYKTYSVIGLPSALPPSHLGRVGGAISDHVKDFILYDLNTFNELDSFKPPQRCQLLLLIPKQVQNREAYIANVKKIASENTDFEPLNATVDAGLTVRIDEDFKIKSFLILKTFKDENFKMIMDSYISEYGYPVETKDLDGRQTYVWGMELDKQKYFLQVTMLPSKNSKKENNKKFISVRAYRKVDYSCDT